MRFSAFFVALLLLGVVPVLAQPPVVFRPEEAVRLALANNPRLAAATQEVGAGASGVRAARARTNPEFVVAPGITSISGSADEVLFRQPLEINGTRAARTGVAQAGLRRTKAQAVVTLRDLVFETHTAYFELARAREQAVVVRELLTIAEEADRIARLQVEEGVRPGVDLAQTGIEVARARRQVTLAESAVAVALASLNTLLGRSPKEPVGPLIPLATVVAEFPEPVTDGDDALVTQGLSNSAEVQVEAAGRDQSTQEARLARAEGRPDIAPQFRVGYFSRGIQPANTGNGVGIGVAVNLPLFDYGSRANRIRQAEQSARAGDARVQDARNVVRQEVVQAVIRLRAAETVVRDYQAGVLERSRRLQEASRLGFQEGRTTVVALLEAQRSYIAVQTEYIDALAEVAKAQVALERATGATPASLLPPQRS